MLYVKRGIAGLVIGLLLEMFIFNWGFISASMHTDSPQKEFLLEDAVQINWISNGAELVSESDPQLILENVNCKVRNVNIHFDMKPAPDNIMVFWSNEQHPVINGELLLSATPDGASVVSFEINDQIADFRVDLGDESGRVLNDMHVAFNEVEFQFSLSRVIAVLIIAITGTFLFSLQKMPDYHISDDEN